MLIERIVPLVLGGLLALAACRPEASEDIWHVRFTHVYTSASDYQLMAERIRDLMEERTDGRFRVVIYPSAQLGGERTAFEQLQAGATHMAISGTPVLSGWVPEGQIFDLPFAFETRDEGLQVLNGPLGNLVARAASRENRRSLSRVSRLRIPARVQQQAAHPRAFRSRGLETSRAPECHLPLRLRGLRCPGDSDELR